MYSVKEIFYTLQGEGTHTGRPAVFCRFTGCNLWSGREQDRDSAMCDFCDTDFIGTDGINGAKFDAADHLAEQARRLWTSEKVHPFIVLTGGEPMLQTDIALIKALHDQDFQIAIETNGTLAVPRNIDWVCVSPKQGADLIQKTGDELKLVYPQSGLEPENFAHLPFRHFYLQPKDEGAETVNHVKAAIAYCMAHPRWRLSLQTHKLLDIP